MKKFIGTTTLLIIAAVVLTMASCKDNNGTEKGSKETTLTPIESYKIDIGLPTGGDDTTADVSTDTTDDTTAVIETTGSEETTASVPETTTQDPETTSPDDTTDPAVETFVDGDITFTKTELKVCITESPVWLHSKPNTLEETRVSNTLQIGEVVYCTARSADWFKVKYNGGEYYIHSTCAIVDDMLAVEDTVRVTAESLNLRKGPSADTEALGYGAKKGDILVRTATNGKWSRVIAEINNIKVVCYVNDNYIEVVETMAVDK